MTTRRCSRLRVRRPTPQCTRSTTAAWSADINRRWNIGNNPNGGYLLAIAVRAMREAAGRPDPLS